MDKSTKEAATGAGHEPPRRRQPTGLPRVAEEMLQRADSPAAVVIDHDLRIIQVHGDPAPCLQDAESDDLTERLHPDLADEALAMVQAATARGRSMERRGLRLREQDLTVSIEAMPLHGGPDASAYAMLVFRRPGSMDHHGTPIDRLRWSLERLRSERDTGHTEPGDPTTAGTSAAAPRDDTSKDATLEAMEELVRRNQILRDKHRDLTDMLASLPVPIVLLSPDLRIRDYTRPAEALLGLLPTDIGRRWTDIGAPLDEETLHQRVKDCIEHAKQHWLQLDIEGHGHFRLGLTPFRTEDDRVTGSVALFIPED